MSRQLLAQLSACAAQQSSATAPAMLQQQLPCLASFAGCLLRHASSDAAPPGVGRQHVANLCSSLSIEGVHSSGNRDVCPNAADGDAPAQPDALAAGEAEGAGAAGPPADAAATEEEAIDLDDIELTERGFEQASTLARA